MNAEKRLTFVMIAVTVLVVGGLFAWRYVLEPRQRAATVPQAPAVAAPAASAPAAADSTPVPAPATVPAPPAMPAPVAAEPQPAAPAPATPASAPPATEGNLLRNGAFSGGMNEWAPWPPGTAHSNTLRIVSADGVRDAAHALRIENPMRAMIGVQQLARLVSNHVYRLSAQVRSVATNDSSVMFGGRVACYIPGQPEQQLVWMSEYDQWWRKELVFTNEAFEGVAVVYAHMGYGSFTSTGEFTDVRLELLP